MTMNEGSDETRQAKALVSRRSLLRGAAGTTGLAVWLVSAVAKARAKFTQKSVFYRPHPSLGQKCSNCLLFRRPHSCVSVAGYISPNGWCVIWKGG